MKIDFEINDKLLKEIMSLSENKNVKQVIGEAFILLVRIKG